jgi:hypothetical protein
MNTVFRINRRLDPGEYHLEEVFADIRTYGILRAIFADEEEIAAIIAQTKVFLVDRPREMFVDNDDGSITIGLMHLRRTSDVILYLDIIHELCHVKQHLEGRNLVQEARRIGLNDAAITNYLCVSWITPEEHQRLVRRMVDGRKRQNRCSSRTTSPAQTTF